MDTDSYSYGCDSYRITGAHGLFSPLMCQWGILYTSTAPLPMRHTTMGYTSMRYTSTALYFYEENIQAPNNFF